MLGYSIFLGLLIMMTYRKEKYKKLGKIEFPIKFFSVLVLLFLMSGFRYNTGTDYTTYVTALNLFRDEKYWGYFNFEPGFIALLHVLSQNFQGDQILFLIMSLLTVGTIGYGVYKNSSNRLMSLFLYVSLFFYFQSFNIVRQSFAMAVVFIAYKDLLEKNHMIFLIKIIVASMFHTTAIIAGGILVLSTFNWKNNFKYIMLLSGIGMIFYDQIIKIAVTIFPKYAIYAQNRSGSAKINICITLLGLWLVHKSEIDNHIKNIYINILVIAVIVYVFSWKNTLFIRIGDYLYIYLIVIIPNSLDKLNIKEDHISKIKLAIYIISITVYFKLLLGNVHEVMPYQNYFFS